MGFMSLRLMGTASGTIPVPAVVTVVVLAEEVQFRVSGHPAIADRGGPSGRRDDLYVLRSYRPTDGKESVETDWKTDERTFRGQLAGNPITLRLSNEFSDVSTASARALPTL